MGSILPERVRDIMYKCRDAVFMTHTPEGKIRARTMNMIQDVERSGGVMWFATNKGSRKAEEIAANSSVSVFFAHPQRLDHVCIFGTADLIDDKEAKERFWRDSWLQYWKDGPDDTDYILIRVIPERGEYFLNDEITAGRIDFNPRQ